MTDAEDGLVLVPVEPTSEMLNACRGAWITWETNDEGGPVQKLGWRMYRAMLDAAPPPPTQKTDGEISQQYAAELARQVDELEAENAELLAALEAKAQEIHLAAINQDELKADIAARDREIERLRGEQAHWEGIWAWLNGIAERDVEKAVEGMLVALVDGMLINPHEHRATIKRHWVENLRGERALTVRAEARAEAAEANLVQAETMFSDMQKDRDQWKARAEDAAATMIKIRHTVRKPFVIEDE